MRIWRFGRSDVFSGRGKRQMFRREGTRTRNGGDERVIDSSFRERESRIRKGSGGRRVLIVTSSYAPTMIADMHRARHLSWELPKQGWVVEILSPDINYQNPCCVDFDSAVFFQPLTKIN